MKYTQWRKVDLHLHSNASHDCSLSPSSIVDKLIEKDIKLFSITDHNNVDNVDEFRKIVDEKKASGIELEFLPGIELRTDRGKDGVAIHLIVIFPENFTKQKIIDKFLSSDDIKLTRTDLIEKGKEKLDDETDETKLYDKGCEVFTVSFTKVIKLANELNLLTIAPHPKDRSGVEKELDYMQRTGDSFAELIIDSVKAIKIMELPKDWEKAKENRSFYLNERNNFIKVMPSVLCSDSHELAKIGSKYTWIKMDVLNFNALEQILFEPKRRIYIGETKPEYSNPHITSIIVNGGYYKDQKLSFSPELNCIIGGRGSGKSVIIDLIRFVFNKYHTDDYDFLDRIYNLIRHTNSVEIEYNESSGNSHKKSRILDLSKSNDEYYDSSSIIDIDIDVDVFSQGKLKEIIKKAEEKIKLIDEIGNNQEILNGIITLRKNLTKNADNQINLFNSISDLISAISEKDELKNEIKRIEELLEDEEIQEFQKIEEDKKYYDLLLNNITQYKNNKIAFIEDNEEILNIDFPNNPSSRLESLKGLSQSLFKEIKQTEIESLTNIDKLINLVENQKIDNKDWNEFYNSKLQEYNAYLKQKGAENLLDESQKLKQDKQRLIEIENNIEPKVENVFKKIKVLQEERTVILNDFKTTLATLRNNRIITASDITQNSAQLKFVIAEDRDFSELEKFLSDIVSGHNVKSKQIELIISQKIEPIKICEYVKSNSIDGFISTAGISAHTAGTITSELRGEYNLTDYGLTPVSHHLFSLELIQLKDKIIVELFDQDTNEYKAFSKFSPGQQCSALLSILLTSSKKPLIIDQPEDELDWNYILDFVEKLKLCKSDEDNLRQFIFVTHNQNITVLGESEKIIKVKHIASEDYEQGSIVAEGGIERADVKEAVLTLEGGEEAFKNRLRKYGISNAS
jgi:hypothetical protein